MKYQVIENTSLKSSQLVYGCMRICGDNSSEARATGKQALHAAIENGYNHFDHADIYGGGQSELLFAEFLKEGDYQRDDLIITSKAGIRPRQGDEYAPTRYDFSSDYIRKSVEGSLTRLGVEHLDLFLLHRPDYLMDIHEVAEVFSRLKVEGKVANFGVSNFTPTQLSALESALSMPLVCNQIEINIHNISSFDNGSLDQCQAKKITPMAWCPLGGVVYPAWGNTFSAEDEQRIAHEVQQQAGKYQCEPWHIALAWILKHPAKILPIVGSTNAQRVASALSALEIEYSREDWYRLLEARNGQTVP